MATYYTLDKGLFAGNRFGIGIRQQSANHRDLFYSRGKVALLRWLVLVGLWSVACVVLASPFSYFLLNPQILNGNLSVMSLVNNNRIKLGDTEIGLQEYQVGIVPGDKLRTGLEISGTGPFVLANNANSSDLPVPATFAGTAFVIPHVRLGHRYYIGSPFGPARVRVQVGAEATTLDLADGEVRMFDAGSEVGVAGLLESDKLIVVAHVGWDASYEQTTDAYPVPPAETELWGIASLSPAVGALEDNTRVTVYSSTGDQRNLVLDRGEAVALARDVGHGEGAALHLVADKPIAAVQVADMDGRESTAFFGKAYLGTRYGLPLDSQYVAVACPEANTVVSLIGSDGSQESRTCSTVDSHPGKAHFGAIASGVYVEAGSRLESSEPIYVIFENSANDDEFNLLGATDDYGTNILIIIADDLGVDQLGVYAEHGAQATIAPTPNIDSLAAEGILFRNVWANPVCSPTRATIQSGRYGYRTGVGWIVTENSTNQLPLDEEILPEVLDYNSRLGYQHAAIGKWHLSNAQNGGYDGITLAGYSYYSGAFRNLDYQSYYDWDKVTSEIGSDGDITTSVIRERTYATVVNIDDALDWLRQRERGQPWFLWLAFNAPHTPFTAPPARLHTFDDRGLVPGSEYWPMVEAMDTEIGRLIGSLPPLERARTTIIFLGDNGTPPSVPPEEPFTANHAKGTLYEGGVNVPMIISGARVHNPNRESSALVNTTDLYATILELAGINVRASISSRLPTGTAKELDSTSLMPILSSQVHAGLRDYVYAEIFGNGEPMKAARGSRYKLIRFNGQADEMYDLASDPFEEVNLLPLDEPGPLRPVFEDLNEYLEARGTF